MAEKLGLYVHIPFCRSKCDYCDFYSLAGKEGRMDDYQKALLAHMKETAPLTRGWQVDTVYFGGGTPSFYGEKRLREVLKTVAKRFDLAKDAEITVECNPDSVDKKVFQALRRAGVNRISLGVQSAHDCELNCLHRPHTFQQAQRAVAAAREAKIKNISLDLIYGLPNQDMAGWRDTVEQVLELEPEHLSCYGLKVEPGTPLDDRVVRGEKLPDDDQQADMYLWTVERLAAQIEPVYLPERKIHLYHCDHRGLPLALISTEGATEWRGEYDEWGHQLNEENPHHLFQPYRLPGQQYDDESGLCYNRYRYYEPLQGRYITQDPIGLNGGWNLYKYPLNPINYADPLGLAVDINHFPVNEDIRNYAEKVWNNPNIITIGTHGDPQSVYDENYNKIDVKTLANEVRNHPKFKPGMSVRLLSCNTGKGNNSFAQQLADELGVRVYAPDQYDWYYSNGKVEPWGGFYDANNQLQMDTNQPGHEFTFKRRKP